MNLMERMKMRVAGPHPDPLPRGEGGERGIQKGDIVRTQTFGLRYRVLRVWRGQAVCEPLSQTNWKDHFYFPVAYLVREDDPHQPSPSPLPVGREATIVRHAREGRGEGASVRVIWLHVDWSIYAHARAQNDLTACSRNLRGGEPLADVSEVPDLACPLCLTVLRSADPHPGPLPVGEGGERVAP